MSEKRPDWTSYWFLIAAMYSTRGTCDRLRTACIVVKNNQLVGAGYNGSPPGMAHCDDVGHLMIDGHCERTIHGEENAILHTSRENLDGATAYIIGTPCIRCAKLLVTAGVIAVHFQGEYRNSRGKEYLEELAQQTGVPFVQHQLDLRILIAQAVSRLEGSGGALFGK